jgi:hypothetical protein
LPEDLHRRFYQASDIVGARVADGRWQARRSSLEELAGDAGNGLARPTRSDTR